MSNCVRCSLNRYMRHSVNQSVTKSSLNQRSSIDTRRFTTQLSAESVNQPVKSSTNHSIDQSSAKSSIDQAKHRSIVLSLYRQLLTYDRHQPVKQRQRDQIRTQFRANRDLSINQSTNTENDQKDDQITNQSINQSVNDALASAQAKLRFLRMRTPARLWRKDCYTDQINPNNQLSQLSFVYDQFGDVVVPMTDEERAKMKKLSTSRVINSQGVTDDQRRRNDDLMKRFQFGGPKWAHKNVSAPPIVPLGPRRHG